MLELVQSLDGHTERVWTLAWNPDGTILATSGADKTIRLWAKEDKWNCISILTGSHNKSIRSVSWSPCGTYLASASFDSTVCIWKRLPNGDWSAVVNLEGHESEVKCVAWSTDGLYLASCGRDKSIWIWERATEESDELGEAGENWDCSDVKNDHSKDVKRIVWHPHQPILVSCSYDDTVKFFRKQDGDWVCIETLTGHNSTVWSADFSATGEFLVTCSDDKTVRIWKNHAHNKLPDVEENSWKCISVIQGYHSRPIYDVSWSAVDDIIVSASGDNSLAVYSLDKADIESIFTCSDQSAQAHDCDVNCVSWNPKHSKLLASGGDDRKIKLWKYDNQGMKPLTIIDELMQVLSKVTTRTNDDHTSPYSLNVTNFSFLVEAVSIMQSLKDEVCIDDERNELGKLLDLKYSSLSPCVIDITDLKFDNQDGFLNEFKIIIPDNTGQRKFSFNVLIDKTKFPLRLPRRSVSLTTIRKDLFVVEKTGDLFQVLPSGQSKFLLGHLFMLSGIQFIIGEEDGRIHYIITADRDEKIRITNWPDTFEIQRFCFGHKKLVRRIIAVNQHKFMSIDQQGELCLWNLDNLKLNDRRPLYPEKVVTLDESTKKRIRVKANEPALRTNHRLD